MSILVKNDVKVSDSRAVAMKAVLDKAIRDNNLLNDKVKTVLLKGNSRYQFA